MTMMIKATEAECRNGMAQAELRYQAIAKAIATPGLVASVHQLRKPPRHNNTASYNPTGREQRVAASR